MPIRRSFLIPILFVLLLATALNALAQPDTVQHDAVHLRGLSVSDELRLHDRVKDDNMSTFTIADKIETDEEGKVILIGLAQIRRLDSVVKGDYIDYQQDTGLVRVRDNGMLMRDGSIVYSPSFDYNLDAETGYVEYPRFWLGGTGGVGLADSAEIYDSENMRLNEVTFSGCPCPEPSWYIKSPQVDFHLDENEGIARHGVLYFKRVPILYSPWLSFPLRKERKSGFLVPTYGTSSKSGMDFVLPYYFNIAPNYDATLSPRYMSKRGLMLGGEFRYLKPSYSGIINGTYLNKDKRLGKKRWLIDALHNHNFGGGFSLELKYNRVSDGDYFRDISSIGLAESSTSRLASRAVLRWSGYKYFSASLSAIKYQTLQDKTSSYRRPAYNKLPEFIFNANRYNWGGFDVTSQTVITRFSMPDFKYGTHDYESRYRVQLEPKQSHDGLRFKNYTAIEYPIIHPGWYIKPKVGLHTTKYQTTWNGFGPPGSPWNVNKNRYVSGPRSQSRTLPIMSLDAGMTFERNTSLFGNASVQTFEPRIYYLNIPYKDQSHLPIYDTGLASFNISQAFSENIFSGGWDRIANANQLTIGLTTRWLDADTGKERLSLSAAQRLYFRDQLVALSPEHNLREDKKTDYLVGANAALTDTLSVRFDAQYNPESHKRNKMSAGFRWEPKRLATISANYSFDRDRTALLYYRKPDPERRKETASVMAQWPITNKWYGVGRYDYSFPERRSTQSIFGLEYKGDCCWVGRIVMQRYAVSKKDVNTAVFFQLELLGLGSLGTDTMGVLSDRIAGYRKITAPNHQKTTFERYQ